MTTSSVPRQNITHHIQTHPVWIRHSLHSHRKCHNERLSVSKKRSQTDGYTLSDVNKCLVCNKNTISPPNHLRKVLEWAAIKETLSIPAKDLLHFLSEHQHLLTALNHILTLSTLRTITFNSLTHKILFRHLQYVFIVITTGKRCISDLVLHSVKNLLYDSKIRI